MSIFQPAVVTAKRQITFHPSTQHKLSVLQGLIVEQPVQLCPLCRGVAVLVLNGDTINGKGGAIFKSGLRPVGVHVVAAGKQFCHNSILQDLIFGVRSLEPMPSSRCRISRFFICLRVSARFQNVQRVQIVAKSDKGCRNSKLKTCDVLPINDGKT